MSLSPEQLLAALDYDAATSSKFPEAALREIISRREEMTPVLLDVLEACRANPVDFNTSVRCFQPVYAVYLLAQFRETRAYRPIIALLELDAEATEEMFGDSLTEDLKDVIAGVYDGDEAPLRGLIENRQANECARASAGLRAYPALLHAGKIGRDAVEKYFEELFEHRLEKEPSIVWDNLAGLSAELGFTSLLPHIRQAYETGLCSPWFDTLGRVEKTLNAGGNLRWEEDVTPIDDMISLMETWTCFNIPPSSARSEPEAWPQFLQDALLSQREFSSHLAAPPRLGFQPAIGRNEPCPCGSGRKYKKCCGAG